MLMKYSHVGIAVIIAVSVFGFEVKQAYAGQYHSKADWVAKQITQIFTSFESVVAKEYKGRLYITSPSNGSYHKGAMIVIRSTNGEISAYGLIEEVAPKYASSKILKQFGKVIERNSRVSGVGSKVRLLFLGGPTEDIIAARFISDIEESLRESKIVELPPSDIGHFLLQKSMDGTPSTVPKSTLRKTANAIQADYIVMLTLEKQGSPANLKLNLLNKDTSQLLMLNFSWPGVKG